MRERELLRLALCKPLTPTHKFHSYNVTENSVQRGLNLNVILNVLGEAESKSKTINENLKISNSE